jgi:hypothetical protein
MPNPVVGDSERAAGKLKKREGLWKPNTELSPNRNSGSANGDFSIPGMLGFQGTKFHKPKYYLCQPFWLNA